MFILYIKPVIHKAWKVANAPSHVRWFLFVERRQISSTLSDTHNEITKVNFQRQNCDSERPTVFSIPRKLLYSPRHQHQSPVWIKAKLEMHKISWTPPIQSNSMSRIVVCRGHSPKPWNFHPVHLHGSYPIRTPDAISKRTFYTIEDHGKWIYVFFHLCIGSAEQIWNV